MDGVRIVSIATMLGAGHAVSLLTDFGAEVISVELPGRGDSLRQMGPFSNGESLRWAVVGRGRKSLTVDLHTAAGQAIVRDLVTVSDVLIENFRPGTIDGWGLGYDDLRRINRGIILLSLTGYGQTGKDRHKPGFGRVIEAVSGIMNSTGAPDGPPMQIGVPIVDYIAGTTAAMAISMALFDRDRRDGTGQWIDLSLYESIVRIVDSLITQYDTSGVAPQRLGNRYGNIVPSDVYRTRDGRFVFHSSATQTVFERLMRAIGREDLLSDPAFSTNASRIQRVDEMNDIVQAWFDEHDLATVLEILDANDVPVGPVSTVADVMADEQLLDRDSIISLDVANVGPLRMPGLVPKFSATPGDVSHAGPELGEHTDEILSELLGYPEEKIAGLRANRIV